MKNTVILLLLSFSINTAVMAQTKKEVKQFIGRYEADMKAGNYEKSLDYIYPKLYDAIPRETMEEALLQAFSDTSTFKMKFESFKVGEVGPMFSEHNISYAFANYSIVMHMLFINPEISSQEIEEMAKTMKTMYGTENFEMEPRKFTITTNNEMAVIKDLATAKFYLLEVSDQLKPVFETIMSPEFVARAFESSPE